MNGRAYLGDEGFALLYAPRLLLRLDLLNGQGEQEAIACTNSFSRFVQRRFVFL